jgi:xanthine dehydrogenase iron-sulfur cluster and FAD-binding subunit A
MYDTAVDATVRLIQWRGSRRNKLTRFNRLISTRGCSVWLLHPGFIATKALLDKNPNPDEDEIREYLNGNICRCTGYVNIVKAVQSAAVKMKE